MRSRFNIPRSQEVPGRPFSGDGFMAGIDPGIVTVAGAPAALEIFIFDRASSKLVWKTESAEDGTWRVDYLNRSRLYYVVAFDPELRFNAVIRDNITPAPMA